MAEPAAADEPSRESPAPPASRQGQGFVRPARRALLIGTALFASACVGLRAVDRSLLYHPHKDVVGPDRPGIESLRIRTEDGETLVAWWLPPSPGAPVMLFFDGNGGRPHIWDGRWRRIQEGGAGFLAVYYRGYSGSTGTPTEAGLHTDGRAGYDWLIARGFKPEDIVIHGFSLGSGVAVKLASERPARALVLEAPFTAAVDVAASKVPFLPVSFLMRDQYRSRDWIGAVRMPVFIAHGDRDTVIPFEQGERLYALAHEPKRFVRMAGSDHATLVRDGIYPHIWAFLSEVAGVTLSSRPSCTPASTPPPSQAEPRDVSSSQAPCLQASSQP